MNKGESGGGFLSKVARFVRHPTVNWSELDSRLPGTGTDEDRQALKAAIERKRRNDQVRKKEFDQLRVLLQQKQAARQTASVGDLDDVVVNPTSQDEDKARTIEKIARIEAQMAQHWLNRRGSEGGPALHISSGNTIPGNLEGGVTVPAHLQARADRDMAPTLPIDMLAEDTHGQAVVPAVSAATSAPDEVFQHQAIEEASVLFANGDADEAEKLLHGLVAQEVSSPAGRAAWLALLDLYHAQGRLEPFEEAAAEFAERFGRAVPRWPQPQTWAPSTVAPAMSAAPVKRVWVCPLLLDVAAVQELGQLAQAQNGVFWLDWTALVSADLSAAEALLALVQHWVQQPMAFRFLGSGVLRRRLKASTPSGRRENEAVWWHLRLAMLRLMQRTDEFDLASLDFCVTYGVLPPTWEAPLCGFEMADALPPDPEHSPATAPVELEAPVMEEPIRPLVTQLGGLDVLEWPAMNTQLGTGITLPPETLLPPMPHTHEVSTLSGVLQGDIPAVLAQLQSDLGHAVPGQPLVIDCQRLARVDFVAAGSLLQWLLAIMSQGMSVELHGVNRLVAAFFHVVGIDEAVTVRLREY